MLLIIITFPPKHIYSIYDGKLFNTTYDGRIKQYKSLWKSHHIRSNRVVVEDKANDVGGSQIFKVKENIRSWIRIPLDFYGDTMKINLIKPT